MWSPVAYIRQQGSQCWRKVTMRYRKRVSRPPASCSIQASEQLVTAARWVVGLNGAGLAVTFAFIIALYAVMAQTEACASRYIVSSAIRDGAQLAWYFFWGGALALFGAALPGAVMYYRNSASWSRLLPLKAGEELHGWSEFKVKTIALIQLFATMLGVATFVLMVYTALDFFAKQTPEELRKVWDRALAPCKAEPPAPSIVPDLKV